MQDIDKNPRKKAYGWVIALIIIALILAGFLYLNKEKIPPPPKKPDPIVLFQAEQGAVVALSIKPTGDDAYTLIQTEGSYAIKGLDNFPVNQELAASMFDMVQLIRANEKVESNDKETTPEDFGITEDGFSLTIHLKDGQEIGVRFGYPLNLETYLQYMMIDGDHNVYLTSDNYPDVCDFNRLQMHTVPGINFTPDLVDGIYLAGEQTLSIERNKGFWQLTEPYAYPAQPSKAESILEKIGKMRLASFEALGTQENLDKYGLSSPRLSVRLKMAKSVISSSDIETGEQSQVEIPAHEQTFKIGDAFDGIGFYCLYEQKIYKATMLSMGFWERLSPDELALKTPVHLSINAINHLDVSYGQEQASFTLELVEQVAKNNQLVVDEHGRIQYDLWLFEKEQRLDPVAFVAAYTQATNLSVSGSLPEDYPVSVEWVGSISVFFEGGQMEVAFYPYDALNLAISINGKALHYIDRQSVELVLEKLIQASKQPYKQ